MHATCLSCDIHAATRTPRSNIRSSHYFYFLRDSRHELFNDIFSTSGDYGAMPFVMIGWPELTLTVLVICLISSILNLSVNVYSEGISNC